MSTAVANKYEIKNRNIPISAFNEGMAEKIFEEVRRSGKKTVTKDNLPECILLSPEKYEEMADQLFDAYLLEVAQERLKNFDPSKLLTEEEVMRDLGITEEELADFEDVELDIV